MACSNEKITVYIEMEDIMKGQIIAQQFNKTVWVQDSEGAEYACYIDQDRKVQSKEDLSRKEQKSCLNLNTVLGDSW